MKGINPWNCSDSALGLIRPDQMQFRNERIVVNMVFVRPGHTWIVNIYPLIYLEGHETVALFDAMTMSKAFFCLCVFVSTVVGMFLL